MKIGVILCLLIGLASLVSAFAYGALGVEWWVPFTCVARGEYSHLCLDYGNRPVVMVVLHALCGILGLIGAINFDCITGRKW